MARSQHPDVWFRYWRRADGELAGIFRHHGRYYRAMLHQDPIHDVLDRLIKWKPLGDNWTGPVDNPAARSDIFFTHLRLGFAYGR